MTEKVSVLGGQTPRKINQENSNRGSLRPPTLMIDLLFGALMLFAFQMGYVDKPITPHNVELPSTPDKQKKKTKAIYTLIPIQGENGTWKFKVSDGRILTAIGIKNELREKKQTPVMIFSKTTNLQSYLEAERVLRRHGMKPGLAVQNKKGK